MTEQQPSRLLVAPTNPETAVQLAQQPHVPGRLNVDPKHVEAGLAKLVLTLVELIRQLLEREAIRHMDRETLSPEQVERLGTAFVLLQEKIAELRDYFGLTAEDLNVDLGPLGKVL